MALSSRVATMMPLHIVPMKANFLFCVLLGTAIVYPMVLDELECSHPMYRFVVLATKLNFG